MPSRSNKLEVSKIAEDPDHTIKGEFKSRESEAEIQARLEIEKGDAEHQRWKERESDKHQRRREMVILATAIFVMIGTGLICASVVLTGRYSTENVARAFTLLTAIVSASAGYATGKTAGK